jgi:hypothetical protein
LDLGLLDLDDDYNYEDKNQLDENLAFSYEQSEEINGIPYFSLLIFETICLICLKSIENQVNQSDLQHLLPLSRSIDSSTNSQCNSPSSPSESSKSENTSENQQLEKTLFHYSISIVQKVSSMFQFHKLISRYLIRPLLFHSSFHIQIKVKELLQTNSSESRSIGTNQVLKILSQAIDYFNHFNQKYQKLLETLFHQILSDRNMKKLQMKLSSTLLFLGNVCALWALLVLVEAIMAANLQGALSAPGPLTVFAPTDNAFALLLTELTIDKAALLASGTLLTDLLLYHVVPGRVLKADVPIDSAITTLEGHTFAVSSDLVVTDQLLRGTQISATDVLASNGVIHVIDRVLLHVPMRP